MFEYILLVGEFVLVRRCPSINVKTVETNLLLNLLCASFKNNDLYIQRTYSVKVVSSSSSVSAATVK